jgi:hypothetical protein
MPPLPPKRPTPVPPAPAPVKPNVGTLPRNPAARTHALQLQLADAQQQLADVNAQLATALEQGDKGAAAATGLTAQAKGLAQQIIQLSSAVGGIALSPAFKRLVALENRSPEDDFAALAGDTPAALLPVRLETRFVKGAAGPELLVRIYPDVVHADSHEPELTADEAAWGKAYWTEIFLVSATSTAAEDAWRSLVTRFGPPRAAWIARALTPTNYPPPRRRPARAKPPVPAFPSVTTRPGPWTRAATSAILPDRWLVLGYTGGRRVLTAASGITPDPVQVGPSPSVNTPVVTSGKASFDPGAAWLSDFDAAVAAGMGLRIPLSAAQAQKGFDQLLVLGVKSTVDPGEGASRLTAALDAHHYTDGLGFVAAGTATNATEQDRPPAASPETVDLPSFSVERGPAGAASPSTDAGRLALAAGIPAATFDHVAGVGADRDTPASLMNALLWPATFGYFFWQIVDPMLSDAGRDAARDFYRAYVSAGGPFPTLRIGNQPYGMLPVTSLDRWQQVGTEGTAAAVAEVVKNLRAVWRSSVPNVPRAGSGDPDAALVGMLGMSPDVSVVQARTSVSREYAYDTSDFYGLDPEQNTWDALMVSVNAQLQAATGAAPPAVALGELGLDPGAATTLDAPWVTDPARPQLTSPSLYLAKIAALPPMSLWNAASLLDFEPIPLLALLARHAVLHEYAEAAARHERITGPSRHDLAIVSLELPTPQARDWLQQPIKAGQTETVGQLLHDAGVNADARLQEVRGAAAGLAGVDPDTLEQLLRETLGLSAARLDAWITALATKRLADGRAGGTTGIHLGAYGWVETLRPDTSLKRVRSPKGEAKTLQLYHSAKNAGYVHAPSLDHAATAAVLRSGYLSHAAAGHGDAVAVDVSSERVREAAWLLDGVREGQPLGALLGYRFERALHERHPGLDLDKCIAPLRALEPIRAGKLTPTAAHPAEAVAAANVVDGLRLLRRSQPGGAGIPWGAGGIPAAGSTEGTAIQDELDRLATLVDGLADTVLAESVHHLTTGRPEAAGGSLDALSRGDTPPPSDLDVARTPRRGTGVTHRVLVLLRGSVSGGAWASTPRSKLEPALEAWAAGLLHDPTAVGCVVKVFGGDGTALPDAEVKLSDLGISALDFVWASVPTEQAEASEVELRVLVHALESTKGAVRGVVDFAGTGTAAAGFPAALWQASELRALLDSARPVLPADLALPGASSPDPDPSELSARLTVLAADMSAAASTLDTERSRLASTLLPKPVPVGRGGLVGGVRVPHLPPAPPDLAPLEAALLAAAGYGVRGAVPVSDTGDGLGDAAQLMARAGPVHDQLAARASALTAAVAAGGGWQALADGGRTAMGSTIRLLPRFDPGNRPDLDKAILNSGALLGGDEEAADDFLLDMALVRAPVFRLTSVRGVGRIVNQSADKYTAADVSPPDFAAVQLPISAGDSWVGLPPAPGTSAPGGRVSLLLDAPDLGGAGNTVAGLFVDEWVEVIPEPDVATGLAFHHDTPVAAPPQAILLAAPPDRQASWSLAALEAILLETLDLAKLRMVDLDALGSGGALAPVAWFAYNTKADTVSTDFMSAVEP